MTTVTTVRQRTLTARDVMSSPAIVVSPDDTVWDASQLMMMSGVRHLVVCFQGRAIGVVDDRTVFAHWPTGPVAVRRTRRSEEHTSELQSHVNLVCRLLLEKKKNT